MIDLKLTAEDGTPFEVGCDHIGFYFIGGGAMMREYREKLPAGGGHHKSLAHRGEGGNDRLYQLFLRALLLSKEAVNLYIGYPRFKKLLCCDKSDR
jgi:hypothetical protein